MTHELLITEKPSAAQKIANALADDAPLKKSEKGVPYYEITHKGKKIFVACAVGHLFSIAEKQKKAEYPNFDVSWQPSYLVNKDAAYTKKYVDVIKKLAKSSKEFVVSCDFDLEGSTIGFNVVRFICNQQDAKRMKFSTLTKQELISSYEHAMPHLDFPQIEAGETRHIMDWLWGVNASRALTNSIKNATRRYKLMSTGRVQGPTLHLIVNREKEIGAFKPEPFWQLQLTARDKGKQLIAFHKGNDFKEKKKAEEILSKTKSKDAIVEDIKKSDFQQLPPYPFDLTTLQTEAYRCFKIQPSKTLEIAQALYLAGLISYPRTSSQQLSPALDYKRIIGELGKQIAYKPLVKQLLEKKILAPNNGKKTDPAHPALYSTGEIPENLTAEQQKIYDLIVRRTLSTFADPAIRETQEVILNVNEEPFIAKGTITKIKGWHDFYKYAPYKEEELPSLHKGEIIKNPLIELLEKETQPPKRFTPSSIIKKMEGLNLGTKSTRSNIVDTLFERNYVKDTSIEATSLGIKTIETLEKYSPEIIDVKLTRHFEKDMDQIQEQKKKKEQVLEEAKKTLTKIFKTFKENELKIGKALAEANVETQKESSTIGKCSKCGKDLRIMYSKKNKQYFISCEDYQNCKTTYSIPKYALPKPANKQCEACGFPIVKMIRKGKRPYDYCVNPNCKEKEKYYNSQS